MGRRYWIGLGLLVVGGLLAGAGRGAQAQSGPGRVGAVGPGGGPAALYANPARLTAGDPDHTVAVQLGRIGLSSGGDLFQFDHYRRLFVRGQKGPLSDAEEKATLDAWFGETTRNATVYVEAVPLAITYRAPGDRWAVGAGVRGRIVQNTALDQGALDLLLRGTEPSRTVPVNVHTRLYSLVDVTAAVSYRAGPLSMGVAPRLILGTGYADGVLRSEVEVRAQSLVHRFDYTARAAGALSTGLYDSFDAFSATPVQRVLGTSSRVVGMGGGLDVGLSYALRSDLYLSASVTGLGRVRWTGAAQTVAPQNQTFRFEGLALDPRRLRTAFDGDVGAYLEHQVDSLARAAYQGVERDRAPFRMGLPTALHVGGTWGPGSVTVNGGVSVGLNDAAGAVPAPLSVHAEAEVALGPVPVRAGVRLGRRRALAVSGGVGLREGGYRIDVRGSITPRTTLLGAGGHYAVGLSIGRVQL